MEGIKCSLNMNAHELTNIVSNRNQIKDINYQSVIVLKILLKIFINEIIYYSLLSLIDFYFLQNI